MSRLLAGRRLDQYGQALFESPPQIVRHLFPRRACSLECHPSKNQSVSSYAFGQTTQLSVRLGYGRAFFWPHNARQYLESAG